MKSQSLLQVQFYEALRLQQEGKIDASERLLEDLDDHPPTIGLIAAARAYNARRMGQPDEAERLLRLAIKLDPSNPDFYLNLTRLLLSVGKAREGEVLLRDLSSSEHDDHEYHYLLGRCLEDQGDAGGALVCFQTSARLSTNGSRAFGRIIACLLKLDRIESAALAAEEAIRLGRHDFDVLYFAGCARARAESYAEATELFLKAHSVAPDRSEPLQAAANSYFAVNRTDEGLASLLAATERNLGDLALHSELNRRAWGAGRKDLFLGSYSIAERHGRLSHDHLSQKIELMIQAGMAAEAVDEASAAIDKFGLTSALSLHMAHAHSNLGDLAKADDYFTKAYSILPRDSATARKYAYWLLRRKDFEKSLSVLADVLVSDPYDQLALAGQYSALRAIGNAGHLELIGHEATVKTYEVPLPRDYSSLDDLNSDLRAYLEACHSDSVAPLGQTLHKGTQTSGAILDRQVRAIVALRSSIGKLVSDYIAALPDDPTHPFSSRRTKDTRFAGSWSCNLSTGGFHNNHVHPQGWISSAYYVDVPKGIGSSDPTRAGWFTFGQSNLGLGESDVPLGHVFPARGLLVLFPSYLWHGTVPFRSELGSRLTVAFDAVPA